ncbi:hypothetical protein BH24ACT13_BH24ACT13_08590 [soil metagenome]
MSGSSVALQGVSDDDSDDEGVFMLIDCDSCEVRGHACGECVVTALLGAPPAGVDLDDAERQAIAALAEGGLLPPLRLSRRDLAAG